MVEARYDVVLTKTETAILSCFRCPFSVGSSPTLCNINTKGRLIRVSRTELNRKTCQWCELGANG